MISPDRTGLALVQEMMSGAIEVAMNTTLNMRLVEAEKGRTVVEAAPAPAHLNPRGSVHGGYLATLIDSATGTALCSTLEAGVDYATVDLSVKMLRPVRPGMVLRAEGRAVHVSRRIGTSECSVHDADGRLVGHGSATFVLTRPGT